MRGRDDEERWAWVSDAWRQYRLNETNAIRALISRIRGTRENIISIANQTSTSCDYLSSTATSLLQRTYNNLWWSAHRGTTEYPVTVVGLSTLFFGAALGAANGSLLGRAPKRCALFCAVATLSLQESILDKHGTHVIMLSSMLSEVSR